MKDPDAFDFEGDYGQIYDDVARTVIPGYEHLFQATLALFRQTLGESAGILVAGCGTGKETCQFLAHEPGWSVMAVDPSAAMIEATRRAAGNRGLLDRLELHHGVVSELPAGRAYDAATLINVMHFLPDDGAKEGLVRSVVDRVRSGGSIALFDLHGDPESPGFRLLTDAWADFIEQRGLSGADKAGFLARIERGIEYVPEARILEICESAGLGLRCRYFGGLLYGGWLFTRLPSGPRRQ